MKIRIETGEPALARRIEQAAMRRLERAASKPGTREEAPERAAGATWRRPGVQRPER